jgi:hypothetical protein
MIRKPVHDLCANKNDDDDALMGITAKRISSYLEEHNLLPAEQKRMSLWK